MAAARMQKPQVILLDIGMPRMEGLEVTRQFHEMPETQDSLIVAVTGLGREEDRERTQQAGFDHHLVKPITLAQVVKLAAG
jgi:CheY-like chemotaxis protein